MSAPGSQFLLSLPPYLGGKRRLAPLIFALLTAVRPRELWASSVLLDPFSGGGAISLYAKAQGFSVISSDIAERAAVAGRALIANQGTRLRHADVLALAAAPASEGPAATFVPKVFSAKQARWLEARAAAEPPNSRGDQGDPAPAADVYPVGVRRRSRKHGPA